MRLVFPLVFRVCALALIGLFAGSARAIPVQNAYTLDASVNVSGGALPTLVATIDPIAGPIEFHADAMCLDSTGVGCDPIDIISQDWLVFTITVTTGSLDEIGLALVDIPTISAEIMGFFDHGGIEPLGSSNLSVSTDPVFHFSGLTGTSEILFVGFAAGTFPTNPSPIPLPAGATNFMVSETGDPGNQTFTGFVNTSVSIVPEPTTAALLMLGLAGLSIAARRSN